MNLDIDRLIVEMGRKLTRLFYIVLLSWQFFNFGFKYYCWI